MYDDVEYSPIATDTAPSNFQCCECGTTDRKKRNKFDYWYCNDCYYSNNSEEDEEEFFGED